MILFTKFLLLLARLSDSSVYQALSPVEGWLTKNKRQNIPDLTQRLKRTLFFNKQHTIEQAGKRHLNSSLHDHVITSRQCTVTTLLINVLILRSNVL